MTKAVTDYLMEFVNALPDIDLPEFNLGTVGLILVTAGVVAGIFQYIRGWDKRKGFRMVLKDRNDKKHAIWLEIIQDGIDARVAKNEISQKEANEMFADAAAKMKLYDLLPKKRIAPMVKETLKRDRAKREQARKDGTYVEKSPIPGDPPTPITKPKFSEVLGRAAARFGRKTAA